METPIRAVRVDYGENYALKYKTLPEHLENVLRYTAYCTEDFSAIAAPCTKIITLSVQSWTLTVL